MVKNPLAVGETWLQSLGGEDPLEKGMATHSNILAWENAMNRGAWWATVHGVMKSEAGLSCFHLTSTLGGWKSRVAVTFLLIVNGWRYCFRLLQGIFGQEDPLEKGMTTQSSILAWRITQTEEPGRLHSSGVAKGVGRQGSLSHWTTKEAQSVPAPSVSSLWLVSVRQPHGSQVPAQASGASVGTRSGLTWLFCPSAPQEGGDHAGGRTLGHQLRLLLHVGPQGGAADKDEGPEGAARARRGLGQ